MLVFTQSQPGCGCVAWSEGALSTTYSITNKAMFSSFSVPLRFIAFWVLRCDPLSQQGIVLIHWKCSLLVLKEEARISKQRRCEPRNPPSYSYERCLNTLSAFRCIESEYFMLKGRIDPTPCFYQPELLALVYISCETPGGLLGASDL